MIKIENFIVAVLGEVETNVRIFTKVEPEETKDLYWKKFSSLLFEDISSSIVLPLHHQKCDAKVHIVNKMKVPKWSQLHPHVKIPLKVDSIKKWIPCK